MNRKVLVSNRSVYHKYAEVKVEVPSDVKEENIEQWLWDNPEKWEIDLDQKLSESEYEYGFGLDGGMSEIEAESETRYEVLKSVNDIEVEFQQVYGGHL